MRLLFLLLTLPCICRAQNSAQDSARLFAPGVISTGDFTFNASFTPDGRTVFFSKATINWGYIALYSSTERRGVWSKPIPLPFTGIYRDCDPFVSADGKRLYFSSDRPVEGKPYADYDYKLFYVPLGGTEPGGNPVPVSVPLPPGMKISYPGFAANGNLYFSSADTARHDVDIYRCVFRDGAYQAPERLSFNDPGIVDFDPVVARDESFVIFSSAGRKGLGSVDLWITFRDGDTWTTPLNMGPKVNTAGADGAPGLSPDNKKLYFCSYREPSPRPAQASPEATDALFHSTANGMRQIYEIDISNLISFLHPK
ncbi:MAG TPA: hypothetical protein VL547_06530 [Dinghuibacter sp.]|uniref:hypothetical protein n=1 Tax=Dinghuibacter sp. TaxID=2024697 RepID=UPI002C27A0EA|nr:hypothetical protein [Dinghuibacter sp.]HTJ11659.1 hypothetical protein [Dinghuibacter sp.]